MRRIVIQKLLPLVFCVVPLLAAALIGVALPPIARDFYIKHVSPLDWVILGLGAILFFVQLTLAWRALQWRGTGVSFEFIPVVPSAQTREVVAPLLDPAPDNP